MAEKVDDVEKRSSTHSDSGDSDTVVAFGGVATIEATHKVYGKYSKWFLFISLGLAAYIYSLDGTTTWQYLAFVTSSFGAHSFISTIEVAKAIIIAVGKPVIAKIADVGSRGGAYLVVLIFYVVGYTVIASAKSVNTVAGGIILYAVGNTGLQLLTQIIIADITTLQWRGLVSGLMSAPFIINAFVGANVATGVLAGAGWRWGYGMFAILVPATLLPLIVTLLWAERKAKKLGLTPASPSNVALGTRVKTVSSQLDVIGLILLGACVTLVLLPLTLSAKAKAGWKDASMIAMLTIGCLLIPVYVFYEIKIAKHPVIPFRFMKNRSVVIAALVGFFDFVSFYISFSYLYSFVIVVKPWPQLHISYFANTQTVALTVFGIVAGVGMRFIHRSKPILIAGLAIRLLGAGLMIHSRGANASDAEIVWSQILQGIGGGFAAVSSQVTAQASVSHADVATVTAAVLLIIEIGGAIGTAIAGAIWTEYMPKKLAEFLPDLTADQRTELFGSLYLAAANPRGDPIREGVILAYDEVMKYMTIAAAAFAVIPLFLALFIPNWYLGEQQNAVDNVDLAGEKHPDGEKA